MNPLGAIVRKGEIKERYFNPRGMFARVQVVSPSDESVDAASLQPTAGSARVAFVASGWSSRLSWREFPRLRRFLARELEAMLPTIGEFRPDVIRGYGPQIPGWFAVQCARRLGVPAVISLHVDYDRDVRRHDLRDLHLRRLAANVVVDRVVERETIRQADVVICAYQFLVRYAERRHARRIEVIYNRVDTERFRPVERDGAAPFTILVVSRLDREKDPTNVLRAMSLVPGARLRIVGDGEIAPRLVALARRIGVADRVSFAPSIPHARIHEEYRAADVYAAAYRLGGVSIAVLEAMASGLPVVAARTAFERAPELVSEIGLVVDNDARAYAAAFDRLRQDADLRRRLREKSRAKALDLSGERMEEREAALYRELLAG